MPADPLGVRAACRRVLEEALEVRLGDLGPAAAALRDVPLPGWDANRHYSGDHLTEYILILDTLNFSFWGSGRGYWQLAESLRDAFDAGEPLWDAERLLALDEEGLSRLIGDFPIPDRRVEALHELAALAVREAGGSIAGLVPPSAPELAAFLSENLSSFHDVATYGDREVPFLKRAQIVAADLWGSGALGFPDIDELTCFADYKLPQVLRHLGALEYSDHLARRVDGRVELAAGSPEEVEIRAATVVAVERLRDRLAQEGRSCKAVEIDWVLWSLSQEIEGMAPYHRVRTIFY
ncbi:MAG: queuosine salvage family protein [Candidatus Dormibacteraeota bacterium]|nr:queuosine salvage family protein [Candidatus Dormibacteraeota bacterium]